MPQTSNYLIVGARFRPPAKGLLDTLPSGTELQARREPGNQYDPNAIQVFVKTSHIEPSDAIRVQCENYGKSIEEIKAVPEWHLGYVPKERAAELAPLMDSWAIHAIIGELAFSAAGVPCIRMEVPDARE